MVARVLWVVKGLGPGGAETLLAASAGALDRSSFEVECAFVLPHKDHLVGQLEARGVATRCLSRRRDDWRWPWRLVALVRSGEYNVIHVHSPLPGSVARLAARSVWRDRPVIVATEHNGWTTFAWPTRLLNRVTSRWNVTTFAVSDQVRDSIRGRAAGHAETLVHGIDIPSVRKLAGERDAVRAELGLGPSDFVIGTVANFRAQKDYPNLLAAVRLALDGGLAARWVVVGQGPLEAEMRRLAVQLGVDDVVTFTGYRSDAARVQSSFDVFTLASRWEGLPVALMEAMALGLPIAATRVGGVAEAVVDCLHGVLVDAEDPAALAEAWRRLAVDEEMRDKCKVETARTAAGFDIKRAQAVVEASYRQAPITAARAPITMDPPRRLPVGFAIRPLEDSDDEEVLALLGRSMNRTNDPRFKSLYKWKHLDNPFGRSAGWVVERSGRVVAVRLFMRWIFERDGVLHRACRAVDTATDPEFQGMGLFSELTLHALSEVRNEGVHFVFNTPNSQSKPGYLKMGWRDLGHVPLAVRPVSIASMPRLLGSRVAAEHWSHPSDLGTSIESYLDSTSVSCPLTVPQPRELRTLRTPDYLRWRFGLPELHYRVIESDDSAGAVVVRSRQRGRAVEIVNALSIGLGEEEADRLAARAAAAMNGDYVVRVGRGNMMTRHLSIPTGGPSLTWRVAAGTEVPPLANLNLEMSDLELM